MFVNQAIGMITPLFSKMLEKMSEIEQQVGFKERSPETQNKQMINFLKHQHLWRMTHGGEAMPESEYPTWARNTTLGEVVSSIPAKSEIDELLAQLEPITKGFTDAFKTMTDALGLNTTATKSNTDAVLGPVNSFLMSLDTGPLAPHTSMAAIAGAESKLYTSAFASPEQFSAYANYMSSTYLPAMQGISTDYADVVSGVKTQVKALPWYNGQNSAVDIGTAVAAALGPALLDIKENAQIVVKVIVDGKEIKSAVVSSLNDPSVKAALEARV